MPRRLHVPRAGCPGGRGVRGRAVRHVRGGELRNLRAGLPRPAGPGPLLRQLAHDVPGRSVQRRWQEVHGPLRLPARPAHPRLTGRAHGAGRWLSRGLSGRGGGLDG